MKTKVYVIWDYEFPNGNESCIVINEQVVQYTDCDDIPTRAYLNAIVRSLEAVGHNVEVIHLTLIDTPYMEDFNQNMMEWVQSILDKLGTAFMDELIKAKGSI